MFLFLNKILALALTSASLMASPWASNNGPLPPDFQSSPGPSDKMQFAPPISFAPEQNSDTNKVSPLSQLLKFSVRSKGGIGESSNLKFAYEVATKTVHLINVNKFKYHYDFVSQQLGYKKGIPSFNKNYSGPLQDREYVLASIVLLKDAKEASGYKVLIELWTGDSLDAAGLKSVLQAVTLEIPTEVKVLFHPLSQDQEKLTATMHPGEFVFTKDLIGDRDYMVFNQAEAYGYLRFASQQPGIQDEFDLTTIAVYDKVPHDIGLVGGVITAELQTPLSHVNVKSMNRNTMNIFLKNARAVLKSYENQPVHIVLGAEGPQITVLKDKTKADQMIADFWASRRPKLNGKPQFVLDPNYDDDFVPLYKYYQTLPSKSVHSELIQRVGAKAANLGLLNTLTGKLGLDFVESPQTLGVPFNFYEQFIHFKQKGLNSQNPSLESTISIETEKLLKQADLLNPKILHPISTVRPILAAIKDMYQRAQIPPRILAAFKRVILEDPQSPVHISKHPRLRLRSSTNSEDLDGFTGAGLYDSDGVNLYKKRDDGTYDRQQPLPWEKIEKKLKEVLPALYSSVWNERAFQEREWYQMNGPQHLQIKVGLAFHGAFPLKGFEGLNEVANGVAVTSNIYDPSDERKIYLNAQHYDLSVTNPPEKQDLINLGESPDQAYTTDELLMTSFTADDYYNETPNNFLRWPLETLGQTSIKKGEPVLKDLEARRLGYAMDRLNTEMAKVYNKSADKFSIDVEWKIFGPQRKILIKQARPFVPPES